MADAAYKTSAGRDYSFDLLGLMPCSVKVPMDRKVSEFIQRLNMKQDYQLRYHLHSNAVMKEDIFDEINLIQAVEELPNIMIAPGFDRFFHKPFVDRFRNSNTFASVFDAAPSQTFDDMGILDKEGHYDIIAFNPLVLLIDKTNCPDLPTPHSWLDLCDPVYEDKVAIRGHNDTDFCEGVLFTYLQAGGTKALEDLGRSCHSSLHPAEMIKIAGSRKEGAPAVFILPYSFARLAKKKPELEVVWPEDGAIVNPLIMLTKKEAAPEVKRLARFFVEPEGGQVFESNGYCSVCPGLNLTTPSSATYNWVGWDFLASVNVGELKEACNEVVVNVFNKRKNRPSRTQMIAERTIRLKRCCDDSGDLPSLAVLESSEVV